MTKAYYLNGSGQKQYRPEQWKIKEFLEKQGLKPVLEFPIPGIGIADVYVDSNKTVYLLDGGSHTHGGRIKKRKDDFQIEKYLKAGYTVEVIKKDSFEWNFLWSKS